MSMTSTTSIIDLTLRGLEAQAAAAARKMMMMMSACLAGSECGGNEDGSSGRALQQQHRVTRVSVLVLVAMWKASESAASLLLKARSVTLSIQQQLNAQSRLSALQY